MKKPKEILRQVVKFSGDSNLAGKNAKKQLKALSKVMDKLDAKKKTLRSKLHDTSDSKKKKKLHDKIKVVIAQQRKGQKLKAALKKQLES